MGSRLSRQSSLEEESASGEVSCPRLARKEPHRRVETNRGDFQFASLILNSEKLSRKNHPAPYVRRVGWIREIQATIREHKREHAVRILRLLRKDLGLEGTCLSEVLYKNATFLNLVDPISHDLLMNLARDLQCPKKPEDQPAEEAEPGLHGFIRDSPDHAGCPPHGLLPTEQREQPHCGGPELYRDDRRHGAPAPALLLGAAQSHAPFPQRQPADPSHHEGADGHHEGHEQVPVLGLDRPRQQCGRLLHATAFAGGPAQAPQPADHAAHHLRVSRLRRRAVRWTRGQLPGGGGVCG
ncbi:leucine-rich repeat-containing protein 75B isoform X3 [Malaclemys terrapin pileata]|uniref:leucine-rich repeat-containing protein 75B isoform X3 n=1 Tax=Malaclemys terrapin pileata TaxID=2991368 RepID=UPI0023A89B3F|nr:leucine-rich repeat-containing protein 75B isoform X3 [Malaclemys terrapin pileata]